MAFAPVVLDEFGFTVIDYPSRCPTTHKHLLGLHEGCTGPHNNHYVHLQRNSKTHTCIVCRGCNYRLVVPSSVICLEMTLGAVERLRLWCEDQIELRKQQESVLKRLLPAQIRKPRTAHDPEDRLFAS